jgi:hypothetical protein
VRTTKSREGQAAVDGFFSQSKSKAKAKAKANAFRALDNSIIVQVPLRSRPLPSTPTCTPAAFPHRAEHLNGAAHVVALAVLPPMRACAWF